MYALTNITIKNNGDIVVNDDGMKYPVTKENGMGALKDVFDFLKSQGHTVALTEDGLALCETLWNGDSNVKALKKIA